MKAFHLGHLLPNQSAEIHQIDAELGLQQRLYALGFRQGQRIEISSICFSDKKWNKRPPTAFAS